MFFYKIFLSHRQTLLPVKKRYGSIQSMMSLKILTLILLKQTFVKKRKKIQLKKHETIEQRIIDIKIHIYPYITEQNHINN